MKFTPIFKGGIFQNNEVVLPYENFMFESVEELREAHEENSFANFFPFPVIISGELEITYGIEGVEITIEGGTKVLCISGELFDGVD